MELDRLSQDYLKGFVKQCHDCGLTEDQTAHLLDTRIKEHLSEIDGPYIEGMKSAFEKSAVPILPKGLQAARAPIMLALGGAGLGGMAANMNEGLGNVADNGVDAYLGLSDKPQNISGSTLGAGIGGVLGLASMLRGRRIGNLKGAIPISRTPKPGGGFKGIHFNPKKLTNAGDMAITGGTVAGGALGGALAPKVHKGIGESIDRAGEWATEQARKRLEGEGLSVSQFGSGGIPEGPWYQGGGSGNRGDGRREVPNLGLLPGEVQRAARGSGRGDAGNMGPNFIVDQSSKEIKILDQQLAHARATARDPNTSAPVKYKAMLQAKKLESMRNMSLAKAREAIQSLTSDEKEHERRIILARGEAAARGEMFDEKMKNYPTRPTGRDGGWFRGRVPSRKEHAMRQQMLEENIYRNRGLLEQLQKTPSSFASPSTHNFINQYGIN